MKTASEIIDFIGAENVMAAVNVSKDRIRTAKTDGVLPASWYHALELAAGRPLPREVFSFKRGAQ